MKEAVTEVTLSTPRATVWCSESHKRPLLSWLMQNRWLFIFTSQSCRVVFPSQQNNSDAQTRPRMCCFPFGLCSGNIKPGMLVFLFAVAALALPWPTSTNSCVTDKTKRDLKKPVRWLGSLHSAWPQRCGFVNWAANQSCTFNYVYF